MKMGISLKVVAAVLGFGIMSASASPCDEDLTAMEIEAMAAIEQEVRDQLPAEMAKQFRMIIDALPQKEEGEYVEQSGDNNEEDKLI
ncbi:hypothetical protein [Parendozoicomonas haliclonae]|uniref:Uncharacterized protein n=1 Tax=Parendozoicomonas haliclonae TaxID=1960125 RepID=A0A1X7AI27_9GAMM|nr:hypothetical protein [Parendozoicomonas haliclonae]SMA44081.1 hypothetical protein EHSB41UT_01725 [Parendozoicomonas haliclonae]